MAEPYVVDRGEVLGSGRPLGRLNFKIFPGPEDWSMLPKQITFLGHSFTNLSQDEDEPIRDFPYVGKHIAKVRRLYDFRDDAAVETYLEENPFLIQVLFEAYDKIREYFGFRSRIVLKISRDPEVRGDGQLFVLIQTRLRPKAARTLLSVLSQEWWHDKYPSTKGNMTISLEYLK